MIRSYSRLAAWARYLPESFCSDLQTLSDLNEFNAIIRLINEAIQYEGKTSAFTRVADCLPFDGIAYLYAYLRNDPYLHHEEALEMSKDFIVNVTRRMKFTDRRDFIYWLYERPEHGDIRWVLGV